MSNPTISKGFTWTNGATTMPTRLNNTVDAATIQCTKTNVMLGRASSGAGEAEEIDCTAAGRAVLAATDAAAQRVLLGAGEFRARCTSQLDKTDTTFSDVPGMSLDLVAGTYSFHAAVRYSTPNSPQNSAGKFQMAGTATLLSMNGIYGAQGQSSGYSSGGFTSFPGGTSVSNFTSGLLEIFGTFVVTSDGTFKLQWAQDAANGGTSSVLLGSWMKAWAYA